MCEQAGALMTSSFSFEARAIPFSRIGAGVIRRFEKSRKIRSRRAAVANGFVRQNEFREILVVVRSLRLDDRIFEPRWLGSRIRIEDRFIHRLIARPESRADDFVGVGFFRYGICARPVGRATAGKSRRREIKASPEEMYRARFADEPASRILEDGFDRHENAPERIRRLWSPMRRSVSITIS